MGSSANTEFVSAGKTWIARNSQDPDHTVKAAVKLVNQAVQAVAALSDTSNQSQARQLGADAQADQSNNRHPMANQAFYPRG